MAKTEFTDRPARIQASLMSWPGLAAATLLLAGAWRLAAGTIEFEHGPLALSFDDRSGDLLRIVCRGQEISHARPGAPPITFGVGPTTNIVWFEQMGLARKLVKQARPAPDTLELTVTAGPYEFLERYRLFAEAPRVDRSVRLTYRGAETVRLRGLAFRTSGLVSSAAGFYRFPANWPPRSHPFAEMQPGRKQRGHGTIAPAVAELSSAQSLLWASFTEDTPGIEFTEEPGRFEVRQSVAACGYLRFDQSQDFGFVTLQVTEGGYWAALGRLWDWMDSVGLRVPADRPDWVPEGMLYSFHPGGAIGSGFKDLGGFAAATERLLPTLPRLGVNTAWILPIEFKSPYWPLDYYRFADGLGDAAQYRKLVSKAHELGLRVWQDLVPHGGAPQAVHNQAHPEFMLQREDGSHLDYWLNDFKAPGWQRFMAEVTAHYMTNYGLDGFRVDACGGSKEPNWDPNIPYARASLAMMSGGLEMMRGIRAEVRRANPRDGAILAEVESTRQIAVSDARYDFPFCYTLCRAWTRMEAGAFVSALQDYLEEQRLSEPRGAVRLRHIESHDSLRSQGWYGVNGVRAMYALSAWIDGMPMIYQGMEDGHAFALAEINRLRRERPELARGEAAYRAVSCDAPGVFTCLRKLGERASVVAINFNREPVRANLRWPGGTAALDLRPLEYTLWPRPTVASTRSAPVRGRSEVETVKQLAVDRRPTEGGTLLRPGTGALRLAQVITLADSVPLEGAVEWFVDCLEGRLHDACVGARTGGVGSQGGIYWRPQGAGVLWQHETTPLHPTQPRLGFKAADGRWHIYEFSGGVTHPVRLAESAAGQPGLHLLGAGGLPVRLAESPVLPDAPDVTAGFEHGGLRLRCVGPEYIVSNAHFTVALLRQGGVMRQWRAGGKTLLEGQDCYGDQEYFGGSRFARMEVSSDVECGARVWTAPDGLHLRFEGQIRGDDRFALKRPPLWYRNEFTFTDAPRFTQRWAFRTDQSFQERKAFLAFFASRLDADEYRFERAGAQLAAGPLDDTANRSGLTAQAPDAFYFSGSGKPSWSLTGLKTPAGTDPHCFLQGHKLFLTLLDSGKAALEANRWYEFEGTWSLP